MRLRVASGHVARRIRQNKNLSLRDVSQTAGISIAHLSEFERGIKEMSSELFLDLCKALEVRQSEFMLEACRVLAKGEQR